jgi:RIO kinase 1
MKAPPRLQALIDEGLIDTVVRQLMSGKEAMVYVVRCGDETRCAKVYKEADKRSFRQAVDYTENRRVKNTREARAMAKGTKFGRQVTEAIWQSAEVDALYRLAAAGVRVPTPHNFLEGVLLMDLVTDANGDAAPRLNDVAFSPDDALRHHASLLREVMRMLCAGVVHGDLSEFNVLLAEDGPVIIDLPQAWTPRATTTPSACCCATWKTCATSSASTSRGCCARTTATRSGSCTSAACCAPRPS